MEDPGFRAEKFVHDFHVLQYCLFALLIFSLLLVLLMSYCIRIYKRPSSVRY
jgi:hypothetical protein